MNTEMMEGSLSNVVFWKEEDNFIIAKFDGERKSFKAKGTMISPQIDLHYTLWGEWQDSPYGKTFAFSTYKVSYPVKTTEIERYIVRTAKWVGPVVAKDLIQTFGDQVLEKLKLDPQGVAAAIKGITLPRALEIQRMILDNEESEKILIALEALLGGLGLWKTLPVMAIKRWGKDAVERIKEDPYILTQLRGIGFVAADKVAVDRVGIAPDSPRRKRACIMHVISIYRSAGHTWIPREVLIGEVMSKIGQKIEDELEAMYADEIIVKEDHDITDAPMYLDETYVAKKLCALRDYNADRTHG